MSSSAERRHDRPRSRSRSPRRRSDSRSREERRSHRSRSRSRSHSRHRRHRHHRSRSRSADRKHSRRSPHRHDRSSSRHESTTVKLEGASSAAPASSADSHSVKREDGFSLKSEHPSGSSLSSAALAASAARSGAAAHAARPAAAASHTSGSSTLTKVEDEPSEADVISALSSAAAAASAPLHNPSSATAPSAAPAVVPVTQQSVNYGPSGLLAAAAHTTVNGVEVKYTEPVEARVPDKQWRLYVFKDKKPMGDPLRIHRQSMYLIGRDEKVCDLPVQHPSCSKQHAVIQFRQREVVDPDGSVRHVIKPFLMDLGSTNGTFLMGVRREPHRYYELLENDLIKFGCSTREYVLLSTGK